MFSFYSATVILLSFTLINIQASNDIQSYVYLNTSQAEVCFSIPETESYEISTKSTIEIILYVAYTTTTVEAGVSLLDVSDLADDQEHILKYNHHITRSTHDLEVWIDDEPQVFKKTTQSRFYYISEFYDVLLIASPTVNLSCSHENITRAIQHDVREEIADEPWNDLPRDSTVSSDETEVEEATERPPQYKEVFLIPSTEIYNTEAELVDVDLMDSSKSVFERTWMDDTTNFTEPEIYPGETISVESETEENSAPHITDPVTVIEEAVKEYTLTESESTVKEIEETINEDFVDENPEELQSDTIVTSESPVDLVVSEPTKESALPNVLENLPITTTPQTIKDHHEATVPPEDLYVTPTSENVDEPVEETIQPEEAKETEAAILESQDHLQSSVGHEAEECIACSNKSSKAHVTIIIVLVVILGGIFVAAIVISIVFHRKKKRFDFPMTSRSRDRMDGQYEKHIYPREGEKLIKIQSQRV